MKKIETIKLVALVLAGVGIILFWIFGFKDLKDHAMWSLITAGIFGWIAIFALIAEHIAQRHYII